MSNQPRLFDGYEVQSEYLKAPGISKKLALRRVLPEEVEQPHSGDMSEITMRVVWTLKPDIDFDGRGQLKDVADVWVLLPIEDSLVIGQYVTKEETENVWNTEHGATG